MPPKKKAAAFEESSDIVRGWPYKVYGSGLVKVGTAGSGQFKSFSFRLTSYDDSSSPRACVEEELDARKLPAQQGDDESDGSSCSEDAADKQPACEQPACETQHSDMELVVDYDNLQEDRRQLFVEELGEDLGAAAAVAAAAAAAAAAAGASAAATAAEANESGAIPLPQKRNRKGVLQRFDP
eukprot:312810-Prymnesium_polylepis.1